MKRPSQTYTLAGKRHLIKGWFIALAVACGALLLTCSAEEVDLKSLKSIDKNKKYGPYFGAFVGVTQSQEGTVSIEDRPYSFDDSNGNIFAGLDVGYSWKIKKFPLEIGLEFETFFMSTEVSGTLSPLPTIPAVGTTISTYAADVSAVGFLGNAWIGLDIWRYRARIGKVLAGFRPYVGAGIGGSQIWFRNTVTTVVTPGAGVVPTASPFLTDEFVLAYQFFAGMEYRINDRIAAYAEYRKLTMEKTLDVSDFETSVWQGGVRIRY